MGAVSDGWFFCTEILIVGEFIGLNLLELPVVWNDNSESQVKILRKTNLVGFPRLNILE